MNYSEQFLMEVNEKANFAGWDFSYITETGRMQEELLSWSYASMVIRHMKNSSSLLDMGTGGGEFMAKLRPYYPEKIMATEGYMPNLPLAKKRLEPLGIQVIKIKNNDKLPFNKGTFDLIINRHESFSAKELRRIIRTQGVFITQQVGGKDCMELNNALEAPQHEYIDWSLNQAVDNLEQNGFKITETKEEFPVQRYYDIGALVYYLKAIPWQIPDFSVDTYMVRLFKIFDVINNNGYFDVKQHRFLIKAIAI